MIRKTLPPRGGQQQQQEEQHHNHHRDSGNNDIIDNDNKHRRPNVHDGRVLIQRENGMTSSLMRHRGQTWAWNGHAIMFEYCVMREIYVQ